MSLRDRLVFSLVNLLIALRFPLLCLRYRVRLGRWGNFAAPLRYSELVQWRKIFDRNPLFPVFSDKLGAKQWIKKHWPHLEVAETVWVGDRHDEVPDEFLAGQYVIKLNDTSSANYFPHRQGLTRAAFSEAAASWHAKPIRRWLSGVSRQEWGYAPVRRRIFVERRIEERPLVDLHVRVSNGRASAISCATDFKTGNDRVGFFWPDGERMQGATTAHWAELDDAFRVPKRFTEAVRIAEQISKGIDFLRVDLLAAGDRLLVGEITLYPASGFAADQLRSELPYRFWLEAMDHSWPLRHRQPWPLSIYFDAFRRWVAGRREELGPAREFFDRSRLGATDREPR